LNIFLYYRHEDDDSRNFIGRGGDYCRDSLRPPDSADFQCVFLRGERRIRVLRTGLNINTKYPLHLPMRKNFDLYRPNSLISGPLDRVGSVL
jgi:hypothetical protein